jgi:hypothetical protein
VLALLVEPDALARILLRQQLGRGRGRVIFVDQLEELVTLSPPVEAAWTMLLMLGQIAAGIPGVRLLATARGDFLTRLAQLPGLAEELARRCTSCRRWGPRGCARRSSGPARRQVRFESEALVDQLVAAGVEGSLPLLQFALAEIWEARGPGAT